jgi:hypothetical protein
VLVFEVLLVVIGVLVLVGLLLMGRSRRGGSDPSTSVDAFNRALSAMEPGADGRPRGQRPASAGDEAADDADAADESGAAPVATPEPVGEEQRDASGR